MKRMLTILTLALATNVGLASPAFAGEKVTLEQVPPKVQETIKHEVANGKILEIEREHKKAGTEYEVEYKAADGVKYELHIAEDGKLLKKAKD